MTMPKMTGEKLTRTLIGIRPDVAVVMCTGFSEQMDAQQAEAIGIQDSLFEDRGELGQRFVHNGRRNAFQLTRIART